MKEKGTVKLVKRSIGIGSGFNGNAAENLSLPAKSTQINSQEWK